MWSEVCRACRVSSKRALGEAQWRQSLVDAAASSLRDAHEAAEDVGDRFLQARIEVDLACVQVLKGEHGASRACLHRALAVFRRLNAPVWEERTVHLRDQLDGLGEDLPASIGRLTRALDVSSSMAGAFTCPRVKRHCWSS